MRTFGVLALAALTLAGCKKDEERPAGAQEQPAAPAYEYSCTIHLAQKPSAEPVEAKATGATETEATEAAWREVCAALPPEEQTHCKDAERYSPTMAQMTSKVGDETTYSVSIKLAPVAAMLTGTGTSSEGEDDACKQALASACKAGRAEGDCVAEGGFEQRGRTSEKRMVPR